MYTACLFCTRVLGRNAILAAFPVGRRLAYDASRGRLWVVCPHCQRWNLTPLEERWEAIEQAERRFRDTRLRVSTGEIALARVTDAQGARVDLVRIGRPLRPELAAWRYGDQFGIRRRRAMIAGGAATVVGGAVAAGAATLLPLGTVVGVLPPLGGLAMVLTFLGASMGLGRTGLAASRWVADGTGQWLLVSANALPHVRLAAGSVADGGFQLRVPYDRRAVAPAPALRDLVNRFPPYAATLTGASALEAARRFLPAANGTGASTRRVHEAVVVLEDLGTAETAFAAAARRLPEWASRQTFGDRGSLVHLPAAVRLALEMAANETQERRALEGELAALQAAWREAEVIAGIADGLALPAPVEASYERLRHGRDAP